MSNERTNRVEDLFHTARERAAGPEREAFLDGACGHDADLRSRVDALLAAHDEASGFLDGPAVEGAREGPGNSIGPYKLLQEIGEGGMGVVYMAEQQKPVRRKVAVKVIKLGMDTKQVIARFEAERQALAMMDHAGIARVLDAGATEAGRPYFVMELVRGVPIDQYCDTHNLATRERLALFIDVCRAVQHAHQKGVIHRDLKPSNVLVTSHDGVPVPKIIDFGVAKATNQRLTERTLFTEYRQIVGTPEYMSPEQAEMSGLDVDTRSDIYALGVLLYQLLTGTTPFDAKELRTAGFEEMTRMIREAEAPAPSTRISKLGAEAETIARSRGSDAGSLSRLFRGDLDWIVMKALEKDRTRRYDTASAFAEDVIRHIEDRPVVAGPPGAMYRLAKFAHRNRRAVAAALVLAAVVGLGLAGTTAGFLRARGEADRSNRISDSLQDVLAMTDPARAADRREVEDVLATVRDVFGEDDATYAAVLNTLAVQLHDAGDFEAAVELAEQSLEVWRAAYGERHPNVAAALARLGRFLRAEGEEERAEKALRTSLEIFEGAEETPGLVGYDARMELADLLGNRGDYAEADALLGQALEILRATPSPAHFRILETLEQRAVVRLNWPEADTVPTVREIYDEVHAFYPEDSPLLAISALGLGRTLFLDGEPAAAEPYLREAIERFRASAKPPGFYFVAAGDMLFQALRGSEDPEIVAEANELLGELIEHGRSLWGVDMLSVNQVVYAGRLADSGRFREALDAVTDGFGALVDAGRSVEQREMVRDNMTFLAFRAATRADLEPETYARARAAIELALADEPDHPAMLTVRGAVLYRQGEYALAVETLDALEEPLAGSRAGLSGRIAPADLAFRALAHAALGNAEEARAAHAALLFFAAGRGTGEIGAEVERALATLPETTSSASEDG